MSEDIKEQIAGVSERLFRFRKMYENSEIHFQSVKIESNSKVDQNEHAEYQNMLDERINSLAGQLEKLNDDLKRYEKELQQL